MRDQLTKDYGVEDLMNGAFRGRLLYRAAQGDMAASTALARFRQAWLTVGAQTDAASASDQDAA